MKKIRVSTGEEKTRAAFFPKGVPLVDIFESDFELRKQ